VILEKSELLPKFFTFWNTDKGSAQVSVCLGWAKNQHMVVIEKLGLGTKGNLGLLFLGGLSFDGEPRAPLPAG